MKKTTYMIAALFVFAIIPALPDVTSADGTDSSVDQSLNTLDRLPFGPPIPPTGKLPEDENNFDNSLPLDPFVDAIPGEPSVPSVGEEPQVEPPSQDPDNEEETA